MRKKENAKWDNKSTSLEKKAKRESLAKEVLAVADNLIPGDALLYERLIENLPGVAIEYESRADGTHHYRYISPSVERAFGIHSSQLYKLTQFIHSDDLELMNKTLDKAAIDTEPFYIESRMIVPGRGVMWRSLNCTFSHIGENDARVFTGLMTDITERKKAEERANDYRNRLSALVTSLRSGIVVEDESRNVVIANDAFCKIFNLKIVPSQLKGTESTSLLNRLMPLFKDPDYFQEITYSLLEFQKPAMDEIFEMKNGDILKREYIPIYEKNAFRGVMWKYTDITAEKIAESTLKIREEKYRSIIDNMNLGLLEVDTEEKILFANQCFCDMCGYDLDELLGKRATQIFAKGENIELMERKNEERRRVGTSDAYEIAVKDKRGRVRWWLVSGAARYDEHGNLTGSIGIHFDITDQKQLEFELTIAREQAEQSTRSKELFLANMSHEIRTPMNAILGMSNQLSKTTLNKKQQFCLDTINSASENLLVIINDILDLSKIEAGKLSLEKIAFEPSEVIKRAIQVLVHKAEEKGLQMGNSYFDEKTSPVLIGDPYRLNQILLNILNNAIKFTEKGTVDIRLTVLNDGRLTQTIQVDIEDTGIGMDESFKDSLFEKFSQEEASVTRQYGGTGLGMSICKQLIELMDGEIFVTSTKNVGTTISFVLKLPKGEAQDLPSKEEFVADESMLSGLKILVVDDNEINRLVATTILNNYGAETVEAGNGIDALEYLRANAVDLVLMDIQMPVMNGYDAAKILRKEISSTVPVIALTANAIKGDNMKCLEAGMNDYIAKPFKEEDLLKMIANMLKTNLSLKTRKTQVAITAPASYYDLTEIKNISRGNEAFVQKMVKMFAEQMPRHIEELRMKYEEKDLDAVGEIAHRIKPTIDNMGINNSKKWIRDVERMAKAGEDNEVLPDLIARVEKEVRLAVKSIKEDFQLVD